jgi:uncharacterized protein YndB with AHSA1/START domain
MTTASTDRIEKHITLRAPRSRVWQAIANANEFGQWFGVRFDGAFAAGATVIGRIAGTEVDAEVAQMQQPYLGQRFEIVIEQMEPERLFSFRWHPGAIEPGVDYANEPTTLITFVLEDVSGGTKLTVTESGFDRIPLERRVKAFTANERGWAIQMTLIEKYLARTA